jgi:hypothetical protein
MALIQIARQRDRHGSGKADYCRVCHSHLVPRCRHVSAMPALVKILTTPTPDGVEERTEDALIANASG